MISGKSNLLTLFLIFTNFFFVSSQLSEPCQLEDKSIGQCETVLNCAGALTDIKNGKTVKHCRFEGKIPIICCKITTRTKAQYFCEKYNTKEPQVPEIVKGDLVIAQNEYTHMVALGYGNKTNVQWLCGGSLISEEFIITAAHCLHSNDLGPVRWARIGKLNITEETDNFDVEIINIYRHPEYKPPSKYNDIALLLFKANYYTLDMIPACLNEKRDIPQNSELKAAGWGLTSYVGSRSERLMDVNLEIYGHEACSNVFSTMYKKLLANGINENSQICAGGEKGSGKDTCKGDSGGPLQIKSLRNGQSFHTIIGITSFGKACGLIDIPAIYTRVSHFVPWIETIVWQNHTISL